MVQHEPGVAGPLSDPAVDDDVVLRAQPNLTGIDRVDLLAGPEGRVLRGCAGPGDVPGARDVATAHRPLLRVIRHVQQFAGVLTGRADVDHRFSEMRKDLVSE